MVSFIVRNFVLWQHGGGAVLDWQLIFPNDSWQYSYSYSNVFLTLETPLLCTKLKAANNVKLDVSQWKKTLSNDAGVSLARKNARFCPFLLQMSPKLFEGETYIFDRTGVF